MKTTGKERITAILAHKPTDRIGVYEAFWPETIEKWREEGHLAAEEPWEDHFDLDIGIAEGLNFKADVNFKDEVVEENEESTLIKDGNGVILKQWKGRSRTPEYHSFLVKDQATYNEHIRSFIKPHENRCGYEAYRKSMARHNKKNRYTTIDFSGPFAAAMHLCGTENLLMGMALEPEWTAGMFDEYAEMFTGSMEILFSKEGYPDSIWVSEDLGFKQKPFISPGMYREQLLPVHKKLCNFAHAKGMKVVMHSCGFVQSLLPHIVESGIDCLQSIEVKAGNDILQMKKEFGDKLAFCGGMNAISLLSNDKKIIKEELDRKIKYLMQGSGYILHSDHSIPDQVSYESYNFFRTHGLAEGTYC